MKTPSELPLVLRRIADGEPVDWAAVERTPEAESDPRLIHDLQMLARLGDVHEHLQAKALTDTDTVEAQTWGHLTITRLLGRGGFGDVFLARDTRLQRLVALKLLREDAGLVPGLENRLLKEARVLASVNHPNVVTVFGADVHNGRAGFWMEYLDGQTLEDVLSTRGPFGPGEAVAVGHDVCRALSAVHAVGLVHRDVKARNIIRDKSGRHVLMDFGAWLDVRGGGGVSSSAIGTPIYLAPEVLNGEEASVASDVYATGVLLFHLMTGKFPCPAESVEELRRAQARGERLSITDVRPDLPPQLVAVIDRALAPQPEDRFRSAGEMASALLATLPVENRSWADGLGLLGQLPRQISPIWATALIVVLGVALVARLIPQRVRPEEPRALPTIAVRLFRTAPPAVDASVAFGITQDVIAQLQRRGLTVRGATSVSEASAFSVTELESRLQVDAVLEGTISKPSTDQLAIEATLVRARDRQTLWSHRFAPRLDEVPYFAARIASSVSGALGSKVVVADSTPPPMTAYDPYLLGRYLSSNRSEPDLHRAIDAYRRAIAVDPAWAPPWVGIADAYVALGVPTFGPLTPLESRRLAKEAVLRALEIDPDSAEAHATMGFVAYFQDWSWKTAESEFVRSIALNGQYAPAHHWYADYLGATGRPQEALREIGLARTIDPMSPLYMRDTAWHYFFQQRYDEAAAQLGETLRLAPDYGPAHALMARVLAAQGRYADGLDALTRARLRPAADLPMRAAIEAQAGQRSAALGHLQAALALPSTSYVSPYYVALVYAALDDGDNALHWLSRAKAEQDSTLVNVKMDPRFIGLRPDPRFQALITELGFPPHR